MDVLSICSSLFYHMGASASSLQREKGVSFQICFIQICFIKQTVLTNMATKID